MKPDGMEPIDGPSPDDCPVVTEPEQMEPEQPEQEAEPKQPRAEDTSIPTPLSEMMLLLGDVMFARWYPDDPLTDAEKTMLFASSQKLERHYQAYLSHYELVLWASFGGSVAAIVLPRAFKYGWRNPTHVDSSGDRAEGLRQDNTTSPANQEEISAKAKTAPTDSNP